MKASSSVLASAVGALFALALPGLAAAVDAPAVPQRIVSVGGSVTEILYALGEGDHVVAVDSTSTYPHEASAKPDIGYMRQLSPEGIIAQKPDLILAEAGAGPAGVIDILKASEIPLVSVPSDNSVESIAGKIDTIAAAVGKTQDGVKMKAAFEAKLAAVKAKTEAIASPRKKVLFLMSVTNGKLMAAGSGTAADAMIKLSGGVNAVGEMQGYKPLTDEAAIAAAPDAVLMMKTGYHDMSADQVFAVPGLESSPAAKAKAFISLDGYYLLGLGPRAPDAALDVAAQLYPEASLN